MNKRRAEEVQDDAFEKRPRLDGDEGAEEQTRKRVQNVTSARQLAKLLQFQQDPAALAIDLKSVKAYLDSILEAPSQELASNPPPILLSYLETRAAPKSKKITFTEDATPPPFLPDLFETWTFSATNYHEKLFSLSTRILTLLLKCMSSSLQLSQYGQSLCKTLVHYGHLKIISRALSAPPHKPHVSCPTLQLVTELVTFDGGEFARQVFYKRDLTFDASALSRNLGRKDLSDHVETKKSSVRSDAIKYVLANLKFQPDDVKTEILKLGSVIRLMFDYLAFDPPDLAIEVLDTVRKSVLLSRKIPRPSKTYILTDRVLSNIAKLYRTGLVPDPSTRSVQTVAHEFLLLACTSEQNGTLYNSFGWYTTKAKDDEETDILDEAPIDITHNAKDQQRGIYIRNTKLSSFLQTLKPYSENTLEQDLIIRVFEVCPELVADYMPKKVNFHFDPKLTSTWIGYASFLFSSILLPVPKYFGRRNSYDTAPPPVSVMVENLLPAALNQQVLTRCLNQSSELITLFAIRILVVALQKLETVLDMFEEAASTGNTPAWEDSSRNLVSEFCQRCPKMKDVITVFFKTPTARILEREAVTRLLALYHTVLPFVAAEENFDISKPLAAALSAINDGAEAKVEDQELRLLELEHFLEVAQSSASVNWWQKPGECSSFDGPVKKLISTEQLKLSPFTTLLKIAAAPTSLTETTQIKSLLSSITRDNGILCANSSVRSLDGLVQSIALCGDVYAVEPILNFVDECVTRFVKRPIKYCDDFGEMVAGQEGQDKSSKQPISLLWMTIVEQWPHAAKDKDRAEHIADWLAKLYILLQDAGEDKNPLDQVIAKLENAEGTASAILKKAIKATKNDHIEGTLTIAPPKPSQPSHANALEQPTDTSQDLPPPEDQSSTHDIFTFPPLDSTTHPAMHKHHTKPLDALILSSDASNLLLYLCSPHLHIRHEALTSITQLTHSIQPPPHPTKPPPHLQVYILLSSLLETARPIVAQRPLPRTVGEFAARALHVLADPTGPLYVKINRFLNRGPRWHLRGLLGWWARAVLRELPAEDDGFWRERRWVLEWWADSLCSAEDLTLFRVAGLVPRLLVLAAEPVLRGSVLRILARATTVPGASTSLITGSGVLSWLRMNAVASGKKGNQEDEKLLKLLEKRLLETCEAEKVAVWSKGAIELPVTGDEMEE